MAEPGLRIQRMPPPLITACHCVTAALRLGASPASYGLVLEPLDPLDSLELPELGVLDEPPAAPGVDELPAVPDVLPAALPDASELGLEPEVPDGGVLGVLGVLEPAPGVALSLDPAGGIVPEVDPEPVSLVEPLAAGVEEEEDASSPAFLQPVAATLSNAARNSTFDA